MVACDVTRHFVYRKNASRHEHGDECFQQTVQTMMRQPLSQMKAAIALQTSWDDHGLRASSGRLLRVRQQR